MQIKRRRGAGDACSQREKRECTRKKKNLMLFFFVKSELRKELLEIKNTKFIIKFNRRVGK